MSSRPDHSIELKFVVTNTLIVRETQKSVAFYRDVLGAKVLREGEPTFLRLGNIWLTINRGGGPTDDKPEVIASPPRDPNVLSIFLNLRVSDTRGTTTFGLRAARSSSPSLKFMQQNCGAICATRMATSLRSDRRP